MRYNPDTERGILLEDVIHRWAPAPAPARTDWGAIQVQATESLKYGLAVGSRFLNCAELSHGMAVAEAMGNWPEFRRLRAALIAGLW